MTATYIRSVSSDVDHSRLVVSFSVGGDPTDSVSGVEVLVTVTMPLPEDARHDTLDVLADLALLSFNEWLDKVDSPHLTENGE